FDEEFGMADVRSTVVALRVDGPEGYVLEETSDMRRISRDPLDLVAHLLGRQHQYPDGAVLFLGTLFAPTADRGEPGLGFTHRVGDVVRISAPRLGSLVNRVEHSESCPPWDF